MLQPDYTSRFKKDYKRAIKRNLDISFSAGQKKHCLLLFHSNTQATSARVSGRLMPFA